MGTTNNTTATTNTNTKTTTANTVTATTSSIATKKVANVDTTTNKLSLNISYDIPYNLFKKKD